MQTSFVLKYIEACSVRSSLTMFCHQNECRRHEVKQQTEADRASLAEMISIIIIRVRARSPPPHVIGAFKRIVQKTRQSTRNKWKFKTSKLYISKMYQLHTVTISESHSLNSRRTQGTNYCVVEFSRTNLYMQNAVEYIRSKVIVSTHKMKSCLRDKHEKAMYRLNLRLFRDRSTCFEMLLQHAVIFWDHNLKAVTPLISEVRIFPLLSLWAKHFR